MRNFLASLKYPGYFTLILALYFGYRYYKDYRELNHQAERRAMWERSRPSVEEEVSSRMRRMSINRASRELLGDHGKAVSLYVLPRPGKKDRPDYVLQPPDKKDRPDIYILYEDGFVTKQKFNWAMSD